MCRLGRVIKAAAEDASVPGLYTVGWVKRGPTGIIGETSCRFAAAAAAAAAAADDAARFILVSHLQHS